jgi:peptide chain release factor 1
MNERLEAICRHHDELAARMGDPAVYDIPGEYQKIAKEVAKLDPLVRTWRRLVQVRAEMPGARELFLESDDDDMKELARAEVDALAEEEARLDREVRMLLLPQDPNDEKGVVLEIRAGTGGEEAKLFAADLFRMYCRYAERKGWKVDTLNASDSEAGGYKEVVAVIEGERVFSTLKFEAGGHRVQRVPVTESQGRIHTSACTVAVMPEAEEVELEIAANELRIDVFRARGPGGQSVNTTDSAVRITHLPTGMMVICQDEKSQHKNKAKAMGVLRARLLDKLQSEAHEERADARRTMIGSGDRSDRIRTYNFPQNRLTDHRIGLTLYRLDAIVEGDLDAVIEPVRAAALAELLEAETGS